MPLQASPAGLLGRFAPSELRAPRSHFRSLRSLKIFKKKSVSQSTPNGLKRIKMQKTFFTPLTRFARSAASATLPTPAVASRPRASRSHSQSLRSIKLRASRSHFSVASLPRASRSHSQSLRSIELRARVSRSLCSLELRASRSLPTPCHSQGPKECPCQGSCRLVQNCGR